MDLGGPAALVPLQQAHFQWDRANLRQAPGVPVPGAAAPAPEHASDINVPVSFWGLCHAEMFEGSSMWQAVLCGKPLRRHLRTAGPTFECHRRLPYQLCSNTIATSKHRPQWNPEGYGWHAEGQDTLMDPRRQGLSPARRRHAKGATLVVLVYCLLHELPVDLPSVRQHLELTR